MANYDEASRSRHTTQASDEEVSGFGLGIIAFGAMTMMMLGSLHMLQGFVAVLNSNFYDVRPAYDLAASVQTWGWVQMIGGAIVVLTGLVILTGAMWARILGVVVCMVSAIGSFYSIPYYPAWSVLILTLDLLVLWALIAHGGEMAQD